MKPLELVALIDKRHVMVAMLACSYALGLALVVMMLMRVTRLQLEITHLEGVVKRHYEIMDESLKERLDALERLLYGDLLHKVDANSAAASASQIIGNAQVAQPEQWMRNRDRELRLRLERLERWRLQVEQGR